MNNATKEVSATLDDSHHVILTTRTIRNWRTHLVLACEAYWTIWFLAAQFQTQSVTWEVSLSEYVWLRTATFVGLPFISAYIYFLRQRS